MPVFCALKAKCMSTFTDDLLTNLLICFDDKITACFVWTKLKISIALYERRADELLVSFLRLWLLDERHDCLVINCDSTFGFHTSNTTSFPIILNFYSQEVSPTRITEGMTATQVSHVSSFKFIETNETCLTSSDDGIFAVISRV